MFVAEVKESAKVNIVSVTMKAFNQKKSVFFKGILCFGLVRCREAIRPIHIQSLDFDKHKFGNFGVN